MEEIFLVYEEAVAHILQVKIVSVSDPVARNANSSRIDIQKNASVWTHCY